jgi:uncharacterized protein (UPF0332 family)
MKLQLSQAEKRRASTALALAWSECESAKMLIKRRKFREAVRDLYYACFYAGSALLVDRLANNPSHKAVERELHASCNRRSLPPRRYVTLHSALHNLRIEFDYRTSAAPDPAKLGSKLRSLELYLRWVTRVIPAVAWPEILVAIVSDHQAEVQELSFDIYHPSPYYGGQTRLTVWQPARSVRSFTPDGLIRRARRFLAEIRAESPDGYVAGLNSRLNQYGKPVHLLMLDLDTTDSAIEGALRAIGGTLVKSGRGFHFIGRQVIRGQKKWETTLRRLRKRKDLRRFLDSRYIGFSLQRGYSTLRLTAGGDKPTVPFYYKDL